MLENITVPGNGFSDQTAITTLSHLNPYCPKKTQVKFVKKARRLT